MKKIYIFIAIIVLTYSVVLAGPSAVFAQYYYAPASSQYGYSTSYIPTYGTYGSCTNLTSGLYKGLRDAATGGQVSALQSFLIAQRYLTIVAPSGYFGALTYQALVRYQYDHGLPSNGTADVATRSSIQAISCGNNYGYDNGYNNSYNNYYGAPVLSSLSATSGSVGTSVTIYGSGFDFSNNTVNFDGMTLTGIPSYQGTALAFTVPQVHGNQYNNYNYNSGYNYNNGYTAGTYSVSVTNSRGTSNALSFTITSGNNNCYNNNYNNVYYGYSGYNNCYNNGSISVSNVSGPTTLTTGTQGVWSLTLYNPNSSYVTVNARWGDEGTYGYYTTGQQSAKSSYTQGQQIITFTHTYQASGYYNVVFTATDNTGAQTSVSATVNVSGSNYNQGQPYLSSISPSSARVDREVTLYGSDFTSRNNTVHFGNGGEANLSSTNSGTRIRFTIPSYISPCDVSGSGSYCALYAQQVTPGTYPVYVTNSSGQNSNTIYFTVTY